MSSGNFKINTELSKIPTILNFQQITLKERNSFQYGDNKGNLYIENGILIYRGPNGTITPIANR
jgi:hypothetical protein